LDYGAKTNGTKLSVWFVFNKDKKPELFYILFYKEEKKQEKTSHFP